MILLILVLPNPPASVASGAPDIGIGRKVPIKTTPPLEKPIKIASRLRRPALIALRATARASAQLTAKKERPAELRDRGRPSAPAAPPPAKSIAPEASTLKPRPRENPYLKVPDRAFAESTLAFRYANPSNDDALAELRHRGIAWAPAAPPMPGVRAPIV
jgi:hypothetical protein